MSIDCNKQTSKMQNIEFIRIIAILAIIMLHFFRVGGIAKLDLDVYLYNRLYKMTLNGQKGVDLFFILSGFFFYLGLIANPTQSLFNFIKKKIIRMWPVMIFTVSFAWLLSLFGLTRFAYWDNIYALLFLNGTAIQGGFGNIGVSWYCSAMLLHFILFFHLLRNIKNKHFWLILAIGIYVCYSIILSGRNGAINAPALTFGYIFNVGMLRAWGGIGIGMFIGLWYKTNLEKIINYIPSKRTKILISIFEFMLVYFSINNMLLHKFGHRNQFMFIIVFTGLVTLFICNKGYISQFFNKDIFPKLSKYVFSIFMTHQTVNSCLKNALWIPHKDFVINYPILNLIIILVSVIIVGVLTYHFVEKPAKKYLQNIWFKN